MSKKEDLLKAAEEIGEPINIRKPLIQTENHIVATVHNVAEANESGDAVDIALDEIKTEKLSSNTKVTALLKYLNEKENRNTDKRISAWIPTEQLIALHRIEFRLQEIADRRNKKTKIGISTVLKILIADSATKVETFVEKERMAIIEEDREKAY
jgi:hypothetical protein